MSLAALSRSAVFRLAFRYTWPALPKNMGGSLDMSIRILFFLFSFAGLVAAGWSLWFFAAFDPRLMALAKEFPIWRFILRIDRDQSRRGFLTHTVSAALSHEIPVSGGWRVLGSLIGGLRIPLVLISVLLAKVKPASLWEPGSLHFLSRTMSV